MEATIFTGWIYDLPHAEQVKVAHPLMLRAIAAAIKNGSPLEGPTLLLVMCPRAAGAYAAGSGWMWPS